MSVNKPSPETKQVTKEIVVRITIVEGAQSLRASFMETNDAGAKTGNVFDWVSSPSQWPDFSPLVEKIRQKIEDFRAAEIGGSRG